MKLSHTVSGSLVLALCAVAFLAGRFIQQSSQLPDPELHQLPAAHRRSLSSGGVQSATTASDAPLQIAPPADPLDSSALERYMLEASGLLKVRPPLPAAPSGDNFYHAIPFQILSWYPRIVVYPAFADKARCEHIISLAKDLMFPSGLAYRPGEAGDPNQQTRTSRGTFMGPSLDPAGVLDWIEEKIAAITLIPRENGEAFNVLQYQHMQHYDSHMDSFDPKDFGPQPSQRIATVLVYLSDVIEGGETVFKREGVDGDQREIQDWRNCDDGSFKYKPRQGDAVLFWSVDPKQEIDPRALHGGCPVKQGEKWAMTKWLRSTGGMPRWADEFAATYI